jgi:hypothetical protein
MAYAGGNEKGEWGLALGSAAQGSLIDLVGVSFFPLYKVVGPLIFFLSLLLLVWGGLRLIITIFLRIVSFICLFRIFLPYFLHISSSVNKHDKIRRSYYVGHKYK